MIRDMLGKEEDEDMIEGNAKDINNKAEDECLRSIHCDGSCSKDDCGVGEEEHLELDECIKTIQCPGGCSQAGRHTADEVRSSTTQESGLPGEDNS